MSTLIMICNVLQHTATQYNILQHSKSSCHLLDPLLFIDSIMITLLFLDFTIYTDGMPDDTTGWRRPIGCLKSQDSFRKRATNYRALLRKMTYKDKASYGSSPPCTSVASSFSNLNQCSSSLGLFYLVPLKRNQGDWDWRLRLNDAPNAIGCMGWGRYD